jgi:hypothetical protein
MTATSEQGKDARPDRPADVGAEVHELVGRVDDLKDELAAIRDEPSGVRAALVDGRRPPSDVLPPWDRLRHISELLGPFVEGLGER